MTMASGLLLRGKVGVRSMTNEIVLDKEIAGCSIDIEHRHIVMEIHDRPVAGRSPRGRRAAAAIQDATSRQVRALQFQPGVSMRQFSHAIEELPINSLKPYPRNARCHSKAQIKQIAASIERFGFVNPVLTADDGEIVAGHGRVAAAKLLGLAKVPVLRLSHLSEVERRAYVIADNKLAQNAGWDRETLAIELQGLVDLDFDVELTGFSLAEAEIVIDEARDSVVDGADPTAEDKIPAYEGDRAAVSRPGDLWILGRHRLICGGARDANAYSTLLGNESVNLIFTDPPYNVPIDGHVCGSGRIRHREFAMGVGELDKASFTRFLVDAFTPAVARCQDGAIAFVCMDWRHMAE